VEDEPSAVDRDVLDDLEHAVGDDRAFLRDVIDTFLDEAPRMVATIREGIATGDVESTSRAAHTLKSNAATLGALGLSAMARELETLTSVATTDASDLAEPHIGALVDVIAHELDNVRDELDALVPPTEDST